MNDSEVRMAEPSRTRKAVLDATVELLTEGGLAAATIDAIRDRSGVSKTTIYKHWPNRLCVAVDAFTDRLAFDASPSDTGSAQNDLAAQIRAVSAFYSSAIGTVFADLLVSARQDRDAHEWLTSRMSASRQHGIDVLWQRTVERGATRTEISPDLALDILFGPVMWRLLTGRDPLSEDEIETLVASVLK